MLLLAPFGRSAAINVCCIYMRTQTSKLAEILDQTTGILASQASLPSHIILTTILRETRHKPSHNHHHHHHHQHQCLSLFKSYTRFLGIILFYSRPCSIAIQVLASKRFSCQEPSLYLLPWF